MKWMVLQAVGIVCRISTTALYAFIRCKNFHFFYDKYASKRLGTAQIKYLTTLPLVLELVKPAKTIFLRTTNSP